MKHPFGITRKGLVAPSLAILVTFVSTLLLGLLAPAAEAIPTLAHSSVSGKHGKQAPKKKPVTSCPGLGHVPLESAWLDHYGDHANLLSHLICSAANGSTVRVKMYFINWDVGPSSTFLRDVEIMHRYHQVHFIFLVERHTHVASVNYNATVKAAPGTTWASCSSGCVSTNPHAISHTKFITVSRLSTTHSPALLTTSTNISQQQLTGTIQSGLLFTNNAPLYERFNREFAANRRCGEGIACSHLITDHEWSQVGGVGVYFAPDATDPIASDLSTLDCSRGGTISLASLWLSSSHLAAVIRKDQQAGCGVRIIVEHPDLSAPACKYFSTRSEAQHDKYLLVNTPSVHRLYEGSQDFGPKALHMNDNFMLRINGGSLFSVYQREFAYQWRHGR